MQVSLRPRRATYGFYRGGHHRHATDNGHRQDRSDRDSHAHDGHRDARPQIEEGLGVDATESVDGDRADSHSSNLSGRVDEDSRVVEGTAALVVVGRGRVKTAHEEDDAVIGESKQTPHGP